MGRFNTDDRACNMASNQEGRVMPEVAERKISPAVVLIPVGLGLVGVLGLVALAWAAPPGVYTCPVCGTEFGTIEELQYHYHTTHPSEPIPIEWE